MRELTARSATVCVWGVVDHMGSSYLLCGVVLFGHQQAQARACGVFAELLPELCAAQPSSALAAANPKPTMELRGESDSPARLCD
jgi:hypothetical protein